MDSLQRRNFLVLDPQWADLLARVFAEIDRAVLKRERPRTGHAAADKENIMAMNGTESLRQTAEAGRRPLDELRVIASPQGFAVYDSNRRKLSVHALDVFVRPGHAPMMQIALPAGNIDVVGKSIFAVVDPASGKPRVVRRIEWADGEHTDFPEPEKSQNVSAANNEGPIAGAELADELAAQDVQGTS